ncbi:MAG: hypothetical protein LDL31_00615 [Prosthecobacter sp.]|jgi:hypothetical protein|nr:hypothetical protein [Prosthecobacter sp.]
MKKALFTLFTLFSPLACAHEGVELGPNGGRILEFSKDETLHGELTLKDGRFHITLLDKDMKPVAVSSQTLTATTGDRQSPQKLSVEKTAQGFSLPVVKEGEWLILQYRAEASAKPVTARFEFNTAICEECKAVEWLCKCKP